MIEIERVEVIGWKAAIRGMRNPMNSWEKSDSHYFEPSGWCEIGPNDYNLMLNLRNAGTDHRKFMRMITVYLDITAPLYWWKEADTYAVGTVKNSCSTMHKIADKEFTLEDFSCEHLFDCYGDPSMNLHYGYQYPKAVMQDLINILNHYRTWYNDTKDKKYWWQMIQLLPSSYNQRRTIMLNYEVLANIYKSRRKHKLDEWREFCAWIEMLPYSELITGKNETKDMEETKE